MQFGLGSLKIKNILIMIAVMVPLIVGFLAYDLNRQSVSMRRALTERGIMLAITGAETAGKILSDGAGSGGLSVEQLFDTDYKPIPNTNPQRYHTAYDAYTDINLTRVQDAYLMDDIIIYAVALDINGYVPTHNTISKIGYGDNANRSKRIFDDPIGLAAVQNEETHLLQEYRRDTGEVIWDISAPIYVNGSHWGGFRVGFSIAETNRQIAMLRDQTIAGGTALILAMILLIIYISNLITKRVKRLEFVADRIAGGDLTGTGLEELDESQDEVGRLTRSLRHMVDQMRQLAAKTGQANDQVKNYAGQLRDSMQQATHTSSTAAARMSELSETMKKMDSGAGEVVKTSEKTMQSLARAEETSSLFLTQMKSGSLVMTRAGESVKELESHVEKIGEILSFISLIAEQASLLAGKAVEEASGSSDSESNFSSMASEIEKRAKDAADATKGMAGLFDKARRYAAQATITLEKDRQVVMEGYSTANEVSESLKVIIADIQNLVNLVGEVGAYTRHIAEGIAGLDVAALEQAALVQGFTDAVEQLDAGIDQMQ
ncbi:MAG: methyl-accepting chemotaxis protein, partial [Desulfotomaculaceae bacterium]|nr:methyl-accepting chemotaxis protein [Desulfotomaculaceae bacterium]